MSDDPNKTVKESQPAPISSTAPGAGDDLLRAGIMQQPDQPGMLGKIGRFDVIQLLGQGGMGQVLLAREPATNVKVAIKVLKPQMARDATSVHRFLTEARHAYAMSHPNVLKVLEVSDREERPFYVMPYIEGGSLARRIGPQKPLSTDTARDVARQIAHALNYAHSRGIIHRDLKPANVLLDREGHAYLTDFGLLRTVFNDSFLDVQENPLEGTAPYMSPAMVEGKAEDTRCDIYSFGAMLYEMLTGQPPYMGPSVEIILKKIAAGPPEPLLKISPKASKELAAIADWAMARELRDRYATMADVLSDLERVAKGQEPVGPRGVVGLGKPARRNLAIAGAVLAVVAMVALVIWQTSQRRGFLGVQALPTSLDLVKDFGSSNFVYEAYWDDRFPRAKDAKQPAASPLHFFGMRKDDAFPLYSGVQFSPVGETFPYVIQNTNFGLLTLHPSDHRGASVAVSIRASAVYEISGAFARISAGGPAGDGVDTAIFLNSDTGNLVFSHHIKADHEINLAAPFDGTGVASFRLNLPLNRGDTLRFVVFSGRDGNQAADGTALRAVITPLSPIQQPTKPSTAFNASDTGQKIDLTSGLVAHFPLDGHVRDVTGNGHDGQIHGNVKYVNGPNGQAIDLDGTAWVTLPDEKFLDGVSNATIALWFFSRTTDGTHAPFGSDDRRPGCDPITVILNNGNKRLAWCGFWDSLAPFERGNGIVATSHTHPGYTVFDNNKWHFYAMTLEAGPKHTTLRVFIDGELVETLTRAGAVPIRYDKPIATSIGSIGDGAEPWIGSLDDLRIYNRTLYPAEIQKLFTVGGGVQNLVVNGSFESPQIVGVFRTLPSGSTNLTGWTVGSTGDVDITAHPTWLASDGLNYLNLSGNQPGSVSQNILLTRGVAYMLSFDAAPVPNQSRPASLRASIGGYSKSFTFAPLSLWRRESFMFAATNTGVAALTFEDTTPNAGVNGAALDNVRLVALSSNEIQNLSANALPTVPPAAPAVASPGQTSPAPHRPIRVIPPRAIRPLPVAAAPPAAALPPQPPAHTAEDRMTRRVFAARAQNLITNGGFELGPFVPDPRGHQLLLPGSTQLAGWTVSENHVLRIVDDTGRPIGDANDYVHLQLNGYSAGPPYGGVAQTIPTEVGQTYRLTLDLGVWNEPGERSLPGASSVFVSAGSTNFSFTNTLSERGVGVFRTYTFDFVANATKTPIAIQGQSGKHVIGLDNLSVERWSASTQEKENLLTNGDFELGPLLLGPRGQELSLKLGSTQIPGWTVVSDELVITGATNTSSFLELTGHSDSPPHGGVTQTIATRVGQSYRLSLDLGLFIAPGFAVSGPISVLVTAGSTNVSFTNYASVKGNHWSAYTFVFTAQSLTTPITIVGTAGTYAIWLDNVSVEPWSEKPGNGANAQPGAGTDWRSILKQADAAYDENRFDEAIKLYDAALAGMEQDQTTDGTILKTMKAAAVKHRGLASFIPQRDKLPADKQVEATHTKLRELNPGYNGKGRLTIRDRRIVEADLNEVGIADLSPLKGLPLVVLACVRNSLSDLAPLRGMPLERLVCYENKISDISSLAGMKLTHLHITRNLVTDLSPLKGMPLVEFGCGVNGLADLNPLRGLPLKHLDAANNSIKDLSPLNGMPLTILNLDFNPVKNLSPLKGMPLKTLWIQGGLVEDLSPLQDMPLESLSSRGNPARDISPLKGLPLKDLSLPNGATDLSPLLGAPLDTFFFDCPGVTDLGPLKGMPLRRLCFRAKHIRTGWEVIRQMPTLKVIDNEANTGSSQPAAEFWKRFDAGEFTNAAPK